jgi:hypothetical protein
MATGVGLGSWVGRGLTVTVGLIRNDEIKAIMVATISDISKKYDTQFLK